MLPRIPTLAELGLTSDGKKKVPYKSYKTVSARPYPASKPEKYPDLPIAQDGEAIAGYIKQYPVMALDAPTGTGKTRYIPYLMASKGYKVRVAIPTTVAVRDTYHFQQKYSNLKIGFAAGREIHYSINDQLVYATTGHFTQRIISLIKENKQGEVSGVLGDILFIDEVHTATSYITLLIGLVKHLFPTGGGPKIVFASATFNHGDIMDHYQDFPIYKVTAPSKPIADIFVEKTRDPIKDPPDEEIYRIIKEEFTYHRKHGIVFRPGVYEVEETIAYLEKRFEDNPGIEFFPAYGDLPAEQIDAIFIPSDKMKVIVGTNIIESSVTIEDVGFIIDDMLEKIAETTSTGGNKLTLSVISQAASQQRRGRTGRTISGRAYKLITKEQYEKLSPYRTREIDRVPIYNMVLQLLDAGLDVIKILKVSAARYQLAQRVLSDFGMIDKRDDRYFVTEVGKFVSSITLSVQNAYMIYLAYQQYLSGTSNDVDLRSVIAVASMIETYGPSFFFVPRKRRDETHHEFTARKDAHIERYHEKFRGPTDIHTFTNIYWQMMIDIDVARKYDRGTRNNFTNYIREWNNSNSMNNKKVQEFLSVMKDVQSMIEMKISTAVPNSGVVQILPRGKYGFTLGRNLPEVGGYDYLGNKVADIFIQAYNLNRFIRDPEKAEVVYHDPITGITYKINRGSSFNRVKLDKNNAPLAIVAAQTVEVVGKSGHLYLAGIFVPLDKI